MNCPRCQQPLREGTRFCTGCGLSTARIKGDTDDTPRQDTDERSPDAHAGRVLDSKYELIELLGEGGIGTVYRARRLHIGDEVAIKVLHRKYVSDATAVERFRREARSAAIISHANVVTIHDFGEARGSGAPAYLVMELVSGLTLREVLRREGRLAPWRAVSLMREVCAGVGVAHRAGVVHRDLKPDNVIVVPPAGEGEREAAKVVDFGLAKLRDLASEPSLTQTGAVIGTPYYMSPEQCRGEELDARSDVYSLGAMLYEMLGGKPPFTSNSVAGLISKHLHDDPPALPGGTVPLALDAACRRALAKNPNERQPDANALGRELRVALEAPPTFGVASESETVSAEASIPQQPPTRREKSNRLRFAAVGVVALLACAVAAAIAVRYLRDADRDPGVTDSNIERGSDSPITQDADVQRNDEGAAAQESAPGASPAIASDNYEMGLAGKWAGTYGPMGQPATLTIEEQKGGKLSGVLEQGAVRVAFTGSFDASSRKVRIKETRLLKGSGWSLGENDGELSADGRSMTGTGHDPVGAQLGMSYTWSFSKQ